MAGNFPTSATAYTNPGPTDTTAAVIGGRTHDQFHADNNDDLEQIMAKLGTGASTPGATAAVLRRTGSGASAWGSIQSGDYGAGSLVNADVNAAAAIAYSKLALANSLQTADLVANAITQTAVSTSVGGASTTTSTTFTTYPGGDVTLTTVSGSTVLIFIVVSAYATSGPGNALYVASRESTGADGFDVPIIVPTINVQIALLTIGRYTGLSAGSHTFNVRWRVSNAAMTALFLQGYHFAVELKK